MQFQFQFSRNLLRIIIFGSIYSAYYEMTVSVTEPDINTASASNNGHKHVLMFWFEFDYTFENFFQNFANQTPIYQRVRIWRSDGGVSIVPIFGANI